MKESVVIFDPTIDIDKYGSITIIDVEHGSGQIPERDPNIKYTNVVGNYSPYIMINDVAFNESNIETFILTIGDFLPSIVLTITDDDKRLQSYSSLTDIIVRVYIRSRNKDFKPIRQNYKITNCTSYEGDGHRYLQMSGVLYIDGLFSDCIKSYSQLNSYDTLKTIAQELGLGFASNEFVTNDVMTRICPNMSLYDFMTNDILPSMYKDDSSFFKVFIDQYYYLNVIEINQMISIKEEMQIMSNIMSIVDEENYNSKDIESEMSEFFLSNMSNNTYSAGFFTEYSFENNIGGNLFGYGDKLYLGHYDINERVYKEYFINPLKTEGINENYKTTETTDPIIKSIHFNEQYNDNVHVNYYYAKANNELNNNNLNKFIFSCELKDLDSRVRCGMIVPIIIEEKDTERLTNKERKENEEDKLVIDRFLSGFYISSKIEYIFDNKNFYQKVICNKREFELQTTEEFYKIPEKS